MPEALAEWNALDGSVKAVLEKLLLKRLEQPRTPGAELRSDLRDCYKIKLLRQGYRLVYQVEDGVLVVLVLCGTFTAPRLSSVAMARVLLQTTRTAVNCAV